MYHNVSQCLNVVLAPRTFSFVEVCDRESFCPLATGHSISFDQLPKETQISRGLFACNQADVCSVLVNQMILIHGSIVFTYKDMLLGNMLAFDTKGAQELQAPKLPCFWGPQLPSPRLKTPIFDGVQYGLPHPCGIRRCRGVDRTLARSNRGGQQPSLFLA